MDDLPLISTGRRKIVKRVAFFTLTSLCAPFVMTPSRSSPKRISVRDAGGIINHAYKEVLYEPFYRQTGIEVVGVPASANPIAQIKEMVKSRQYLWDMAALGEMAILLLTIGAGDQCFIEKHQLEHDPVISKISAQFMSPYGVGTNVYSTVLAYRTDAFGKHQLPQTWKDLWDIKNFSGCRGLYKHPLDTTEVALMADGIPANDIYPCDLDRAFHSLDKIKRHISVWWTSGPQVEHLLKSGEINLTSAWVSRVQTAINEGAPVAFSWDQHIYQYDSWAILKDTPNASACREFIKFASDPKRQALLAEYAIGPTQQDAFNYIKPKQAMRLTSYPANLEKGKHIDAAYWCKNQDRAIQRFNEWLLGHPNA